MKTRALVYVRKSIVKNHRDEISSARQLVNCQTAAELHGWYVGSTDVYQDADGHRSGRTEDHRPAWQALKSRIASDPTVAAVVVNSLDGAAVRPKTFSLSSISSGVTAWRPCPSPGAATYATWSCSPTLCPVSTPLSSPKS